MTEGYELAFLIGGLFLSLSAFSLILGDNYLFRLGSAILSGAVSAYICVLLAENYFYPLILDLINDRNSLTTWQIARTVIIVIGILLLFTRAYTNSKTGGRLLLTMLTAISAAVLLSGAAGGTIPAMIRSISGRFRLAVLTPEERSDIWYWIKNITVAVSALAALLYTRHYSFSGKRAEKSGNGSLFGSILIGFTFGAVTAAVFLTAANILVNHISELIGTIQSLMK